MNYPGRCNEGIIVVNIITKLTIATAGLAAAMCFDALPSLAFGDGAWCAMINKGDGEAYLDCQYRTFEECRSAAAADRGFCNLNPAPGSSARAGVTQPGHQKRGALQH
jgi:hypothetical protein